MLQNDNNDDIWKPLKIPQCVSESKQKCKGTKCHSTEAQKNEPGFTLYTVNYSHNSFTNTFLSNYLTQFAGKKIIKSLLALTVFVEQNSASCYTILSTKTKLG